MFGKSNRRQNGQPAYDERPFITSDARQFAFDDLNVIQTSQSGLAGLVPLHFINAAEAASGFDYMTNVIGLGGTVAPVHTTTPLIDDPRFTQSFFEDQS